MRLHLSINLRVFKCFFKNDLCLLFCLFIITVGQDSRKATAQDHLRRKLLSILAVGSICAIVDFLVLNFSIVSEAVVGLLFYLKSFRKTSFLRSSSA